MSSFTQPGVKGGWDSSDSSSDDQPKELRGAVTQSPVHRKSGPRTRSDTTGVSEGHEW